MRAEDIDTLVTVGRPTISRRRLVRDLCDVTP